MRRIGLATIVLIAAVALSAPMLAPHDASVELRDFLFAPPTQIRMIDAAGGWQLPFIYRLKLVSRLEQRYEEDTSTRVPLEWLANGRLVQSSDETAPLFIFGADSFGRDIFSRLLYGARTSLGLALAATAGALAIGLLIGGLSGVSGGLVDEALMRTAEFVLVLPAIYVVLALRAALPLVVPPATLFVMMTAILALVGWPHVARGVRGIVAAEARREYAVAATSLGASRTRLLFRHLLPASFGFVAVQTTLLVPAFILAEATLSYVALGFPDQVPSWGTMLREAASVATLVDFPWALAPAAAIVVVALACNLVLQAGPPTRAPHTAAARGTRTRQPRWGAVGADSASGSTLR